MTRGEGLAMTVKFEIKFWENRGKTLTMLGDVIYSICQLKGRRRVSKVLGLERTVRIRQRMGGVYPRLILDSPSVVARLTKSAEAISVGTGDCHAPFRCSQRQKGMGSQ